MAPKKTNEDGVRPESAGPTESYKLTARELEILSHAAEGKSDKEIAFAIGVSPLTVHSHVRRILQKMDSTSRTEACVRALRAGLIA